MTLARRTASLHRLLVPVLLAALVLPACGADGATPAGADPTVPTSAVGAPVAPGDTIEITTVGDRFVGVPNDVPAGAYDLRLVNRDDVEHEVLVFRNTSGLRMDELAASGSRGPALVDLAGSTYARPGSAASPLSVELARGTYTVVCLVPAADDSRPVGSMRTTLTVS